MGNEALMSCARETRDVNRRARDDAKDDAYVEQVHAREA